MTVVDYIEELAKRFLVLPMMFEETAAVKSVTEGIFAGSKSHIKEALFTQSMLPLSERIERATKAITSDDVQKALDLWKSISPYIKAESEAHPELYGDDAEHPASADELIAAAARRARANGVDIPRLKVDLPKPEERAEQLVFHIDIPAGGQQTIEDVEAAEARKEETRRQNIADARKRRELAEQQGAMIPTDIRLATIADKELGFSYFTREGIKQLPKDIRELTIDKNTGKINLYDLSQGKATADVLQEVDSLHTSFLMWLLWLAGNNSDIRETNSSNAIISIYLPAVLEGMKIDPRPRKRNAETKQLERREPERPLPELRRDRFMEFISPLRNVAGFIGDDLYQIVGFYSYNAESETIEITAPYMFKLVEYAKLHATKHAAISNIFHADIMAENQTAVEVANRIAMGLISRGVSRPDSETYNNAKHRQPIKTKTTKTAADGTKTVEEQTFAPEPVDTVTKSRTDENGVTTTVTGARKQPRNITFKIRYSSLIDDCPELKRELDAIRNGTGAAEAAARASETATADEIAAARRTDHKSDSQRVNKKLHDVFTAAIRIIMEKSDIPQYYANLTIRTGRFDTFKAPTNSTITDYLIITHTGKNPNFSE